MTPEQRAAEILAERRPEVRGEAAIRRHERAMIAKWLRTDTAKFAGGDKVQREVARFLRKLAADIESGVHMDEP